MRELSQKKKHKERQMAHRFPSWLDESSSYFMDALASAAKRAEEVKRIASFLYLYPNYRPWLQANKTIEVIELET